MVEFTVTGEALWQRMERAVEKVNERLRKTVCILEDSDVPYAVVGGHAIRAWVAQVDETAVRTTRDVDILVRPVGFPRLVEVMEKAGFHHRRTGDVDIVVEHPDASACDAVHILLAGKRVRPGDVDPNPDIEPNLRSNEFRTIPLESLVRMKLNSFRDKDRVHLRDLIAIGLIDEQWLDKWETPLRNRLKELLDTPDG